MYLLASKLKFETRINNQTDAISNEIVRRSTQLDLRYLDFC